MGIIIHLFIQQLLIEHLYFAMMLEYEDTHRLISCLHGVYCLMVVDKKAINNTILDSDNCYEDKESKVIKDNVKRQF